MFGGDEGKGGYYFRDILETEGRQGFFKEGFMIFEV